MARRGWSTPTTLLSVRVEWCAQSMVTTMMDGVTDGDGRLMSRLIPGDDLLSPLCLVVPGRARLCLVVLDCAWLCGRVGHCMGGDAAGGPAQVSRCGEVIPGWKKGGCPVSSQIRGGYLCWALGSTCGQLWSGRHRAGVRSSSFVSSCPRRCRCFCQPLRCAVPCCPRR
jgi:hypothetical protein